MKDKMYMVLAFLGVIILIVVYVLNKDTTKSVVNYDAIDSFYIPKDQAYNNDNAANEIFAELNGSRAVHCPNQELKQTGARTSIAIATGNQKPTYGAVCFFCNGDTTGRYNVIGSASDLESMPGIDKMKTTGPVSFADLGATGTKSGTKWDRYYEIIAPFSFQFANNNTDGTGKIQIVNTKGTCRITFENVANWACAGAIGTETVTGSGTLENNTPWELHDTHHLSIWGKSANAAVKKGIDGHIIGYASPETTVYIEKIDDRGVTPISIYEFVTSVTN